MVQENNVIAIIIIMFVTLGILLGIVLCRIGHIARSGSESSESSESLEDGIDDGGFHPMPNIPPQAPPWIGAQRPPPRPEMLPMPNPMQRHSHHDHRNQQLPSMSGAGGRARKGGRGSAPPAPDGQRGGVKPMMDSGSDDT